MKKQEERELSRGIQLDPPSFATTQPLMQALDRPSTLTTSSAPAHRYHLPPNTAGQSNIRIRTPPPSHMPSPPRCPAVPIPQYVQMPVLIVPVNEKFELAGRKPDQPMQSQQTPVPGSTACYRRKVQRELNQGKRVKRYAPRLGRNICSKCRQPKTAPDHRHHYGNWFCRATSKETESKLEERMKSMGFSSRKRKHQVEPCPVFLWQDQRGVDGGQQADGHDWFLCYWPSTRHTVDMVSNS